MSFSQGNGFISEKFLDAWLHETESNGIHDFPEKSKNFKNAVIPVEKFNLGNLFTIPDFQGAFPQAVDKVTEVYYNSGADEGGTVQINRDGFKRFGKN